MIARNTPRVNKRPPPKLRDVDRDILELVTAIHAARAGLMKTKYGQNIARRVAKFAMMLHAAESN